jgi:hypothetical protein
MDLRSTSDEISPSFPSILRNGGIWDKEGQPSSDLKAHYNAAMINGGLDGLLAVQRICTKNSNLSLSLVEKGLSSRAVLPVKALREHRSFLCARGWPLGH